MKKLLSAKKIIITAVVLVALILAGLVGAYFGLKTIRGGWELTENPEVAVSTVDEIPESDKAYYVFDKPDRYGRGQWHTCYQGGVEYYEYELLEDNGVKKINLGSGDMEYIIKGSRLFGNAKLTIIFPAYTDESTGESYEAEQYVFEQAKAPKYEKSAYKDFEVDKNLLNTWTSNERTLSYYYYLLSYTQVVEFTDNGIMTIRYESEDLALDRYMYYAYTADEGELTFSLVTDKETKYTVSYEFDAEGNLKFTNDTTASSIFADAIFGEFTYYTEANLPEPTDASVDEMYLTE